MVHRVDIDALYDAFQRDLPEELRASAVDLPFRLALVPCRFVPWSQVFNHPVTLGAPALFLEGMHGVRAREAQDSVLAHLLAVVEAFGTDRILDGQIEDAIDLRDVLEHARRARDAALFRLRGHGAVAAARDADRRTLEAIARERRLLTAGGPVDLPTYELVSAGKQAVGLPATLALAEAAGYDGPRLEAVRATLMGVWLGLQLVDDVVDWEDDAARGGAWAVALSRHAGHGSADERCSVLESGVLAMLLHRATAHFDEAARGAASLGATELARWAGVRETEARALHERERASPGYFARLTKLSSWREEVLG